MQAVIAFFFGLLFLAIAILGFVAFLSEGDAFGALSSRSPSWWGARSGSPPPPTPGG